MLPMLGLANKQIRCGLSRAFSMTTRSGPQAVSPSFCVPFRSCLPTRARLRWLDIDVMHSFAAVTWRSRDLALVIDTGG